MQQMELNGDVLEKLCPEQVLETSAIALGLFGKLVCLRQEAGEGRTDTLQRCLAEHSKFCVMHDKGQPEFVLKFVTATPFRKYLSTKIGSVYGGWPRGSLVHVQPCVLFCQ